jgi:hypothetical protein
MHEETVMLRSLGCTLLVVVPLALASLGCGNNTESPSTTPSAGKTDVTLRVPGMT